MKPHYSFILYEEKNPPKYFQIEKRTLKIILFGIPFAALMALTLITLIYLKSRNITSLKSGPAIDSGIVQRMQTEKKLLEQEIRELKSSETELLNRISSESMKSISQTSLFAPAVGSSDLTSNKMIKVDQSTILSESSNEKIKFNLINATQEMKILGHIFVLKKEGNLLSFYPPHALTDELLPIPFHKGEPFTMSRLRPVEATFAKSLAGGATYTVIIFSRSGDLLLKAPLNPLQGP